MREAGFRFLVNKHDPDFSFVQFQQCDMVYHEFLEDEGMIPHINIDEEVGDLIAACKPDVTLLVSDHGIGPIGS